MGESRVPGPSGVDSTDQQRFWGTNPSQRPDPPLPGVVGTDAVPLGAGVVTKVVKKYDKDNPTTSGGVEVKKATKIRDVFAELNTASATGEWGKGGARDVKITYVDENAGVVQLEATLLKVLPTWKNYASATAGAKKAWDTMVKALEKHEARHLEIAATHLDALADALVVDKVGSNDTDLAAKQKVYVGKIDADQKKLDKDSENGAKEGHAYGDVILVEPEDGG